MTSPDVKYCKTHLKQKLIPSDLREDILTLPFTSRIYIAEDDMLQIKRTAKRLKKNDYIVTYTGINFIHIKIYLN
jgi:RNase P/RNase MRP subunit p30